MISDHPFLAGLLGDAVTAERLGDNSELAAMLEFEKALALAQAMVGVIPEESARRIAETLDCFDADRTALAEGASRDGVVVPELVAQIRRAVGKEHGRHVHFGATSQDVIDTALSLRLVPVLSDFAERIDKLSGKLEAVCRRDGSIFQFAHTRMQKAVPVPVARKIASWRGPLLRRRDELDAVRGEVLILHLGGAAGTNDRLGVHAEAVAVQMAKQLNLRPVEAPRHSERDGHARFAGWLSSTSAGLGKMGQDIALMVQNEVGQISLSGGGRSSVMAHKVNPVGAETLVCLARFNATLISAMHHGIIHENERSGASWTLEWMVLPQMVLATAASLRTSLELVDTITFVASAPTQ